MQKRIAKIARKVFEGKQIDYFDAVGLSTVSNHEELFKAANSIREKFIGNKFDLCTIINAKSGMCSEDCSFCAQSRHYKTNIENYSMLDIDSVLKLARDNEKEGVKRFSLVTSGKVINAKDFEKVLGIIKALKCKTNLKVCASLGCISYQQAKALKKVGLELYHHNVETSSNYFKKICTTHTYEERISTIKNVMKAGLKVCSGGIIGLGEGMEERIKMAFEIRELGIKSIPINILNPIIGTPLEKVEKIDPIEVLKTIAVFRFIIPDSIIRYAGGRSLLGELETAGLKAGVNAAIVGNYLTTIGKSVRDDIRTVKELGFEV